MGAEETGDYEYEVYRSAVALLEEVKVRAHEIGRALMGKDYRGLYDLAEDVVAVQYNRYTKCDCHPEVAVTHFPASWLFDDGWKERVKERKAEERRRLEMGTQVVQAKTAAEASERALLARLKAKYPEEG